MRMILILSFFIFLFMIAYIILVKNLTAVREKGWTMGYVQEIRNKSFLETCKYLRGVKGMIQII